MDSTSERDHRSPWRLPQPAMPKSYLAVFFHLEVAFPVGALPRPHVRRGSRQLPAMLSDSLLLVVSAALTVRQPE